MEREIVTADGERKTVTGETITEFDGSVFVFPDDSHPREVLVGRSDYEKYEGARLA